MVEPVSGIVTMLRRAPSTALGTASETSLALPVAKPTRPLPSPTATSALNEKRRPPFPPLAPRARQGPQARQPLVPVGFSAMSELQSALAGAVGQRLHAAVVPVSSAVEDDLRHARFLRARSDPLAHLGRALRLRPLDPLVGHRHQRVTLVVVDDL